MEIDKRFLLVSEQYLHVSKILFDNMIASGNKHVVISNKEVDEEEYMEITKYSDFSVLIPSLFNFYHGLELLMKGMIRLNEEDFKESHSFEKLFEKLERIETENPDYIEVIGKYVTQPVKIIFLKEYMSSEHISNIQELYMSFRYPTDLGFKKIREYTKLKYQEGGILKEIKEISDDIKIIIRSAVKEFRKAEDSRTGSK